MGHWSTIKYIYQVLPHLIPQQGETPMTRQWPFVIKLHPTGLERAAIMTDTGITGLNILLTHMLYVTVHT